MRSQPSMRRRSTRRGTALVLLLLPVLSSLGIHLTSLTQSSVRPASAALFPVVGHMAASPHLSTSAVDQSGSAQNGEVDYGMSQLLLDPGARRGYQVVGWDRLSGGWETEITVFDLDRLTVVDRVELDGIQPGGLGGDYLQAGSESFPAALAPAPHPRLFFVAGQTSSRPGIGPEDLVTVDLTTLSVTGDVSLQPTLPAACENLTPTPCPTLGLDYDARSGLVYTYTAQSEVNLVIPTVFTFAIDAVDPVTQRVVGSAALPSTCNSTLSGPSGDNHEDQYMLFRSTDGGTIWTICVNSSATSQTVAPVALASDAHGMPANSPPPLVADGVGGVQDAYADSGSDRVFLRESAAGDRLVVVFDGRHGQYVGSAGLGSERSGSGGAAYTPFDSGNGVDPTTGRFYNVSEGGIYLVDGRRTDRQGFPQATVFPFRGLGSSGDRPVLVDPVTRHVFVLGYSADVSAGVPISGTGYHVDAQYTVYQDNVPPSADVPLSGLDSNTGNVPLVPGSTVAIYAAHAQGFGSRSYTYNPTSVLTGTGNSQPNPAGGVSDVIQAGATSVAGEGSGADLTNNGASAAGITADADAQTRQQFSKTNQSFPYAQVPCDDTSGTEVKKATSADPGGSTQVDCNLAQGTALVNSAYRSSEAAAGTAPPTSPSESDVSVTVSYAVCPAAPVCNGIGSGPSAVSTATATVHGIDLAATVSISYLQVTATAVAGGRSGTAVTKYATTIRGVHAGAYDCSTSCDPSAALQQINLALAQQLPGQVQVVFPAADATAAQGTPKGYYAAVEKDTYALLNDTTVSGDSRPELVGMEEIRDNAALYNGSQAKQIIDFGGVEVESRFGVTPLDLGTPTVGTGAITAGPSIPDTAGTAGHYVPGNAVAGVAATSQPSRRSAGSRSNSPNAIATVVNGLAWLLDWTQLPLMSLMWIVLLLPAYLATRRQRLEVLAL